MNKREGVCKRFCLSIMHLLLPLPRSPSRGLVPVVRRTGLASFSPLPSCALARDPGSGAGEAEDCRLGESRRHASAIACAVASVSPRGLPSPLNVGDSGYGRPTRDHPAPRSRTSPASRCVTPDAPARGRLAYHGLPGLRKELRVRRGLDPSSRAALFRRTQARDRLCPARATRGGRHSPGGGRAAATQPAEPPGPRPPPGPGANRSTDTAKATEAT